MRMNRVSITLALAACLSILPCSATAAELIRNGGFETGDFADWQTLGDQSYTGVAPADTAPSLTIGDYRAYFGSASGGGIQQIFATTEGQAYNISFWLGNDGGPDTGAFVLFGGDTILSLVRPEAFGLRQISLTATATGPATALSFVFAQPENFWNLDNVSVQAVPEPATWALMVSGFGAAGFAMRRRRRPVRVADAR